MKCHFCAETIQDEALLCRFCGAEKSGEEWRSARDLHPQPAAASAVGGMTRFNIVGAGLMLLLSAAWALIFVTAEVPLLGEVRGGVAAVAYNGLFAAMFLVMGVGLLQAKRWGYLASQAVILLYCGLRLIGLLDTAARTAQYRKLMSDAGSILGAYREMVDKEMMFQIENIIVGAIIACWLGFGLYLSMRRAYFDSGKSAPPTRPTMRRER